MAADPSTFSAENSTRFATEPLGWQPLLGEEVRNGPRHPSDLTTCSPPRNDE